MRADDAATVGAADIAIKLLGYLNVIVLPTSRAPPTLTLNDKVTAVPVFKATRPAADI